MDLISVSGRLEAIKEIQNQIAAASDLDAIKQSLAALAELVAADMSADFAGDFMTADRTPANQHK